MRMTRARSLRSGGALLSVLWVIAGVSTVVFALSVTAHQAFIASRNRINAERAHWHALGCIAARLAAVDEVLRAAGELEAVREAWRSIDEGRLALTLPPDAGCVESLEAAGARLDINAATSEQLLALFGAVGLGSGRRDLAEALHDWTDADRLARPIGAEAEWYRARGRLAPRDEPIADLDELRFVRGFESSADRLRPFLSTIAEQRVSLDHAPDEVLSTLPGFTAEVVALVRSRQRSGRPIDDLRQLIDLVSPNASEGLSARFPELVRLAVAGTEHWILTVVRDDGRPAVRARIAAELALVGGEVDVVRWSLR
jgi:type II secretory pathway component PulK